LESAHSDFDGSDREFEEFIENLMMEYEPYWKPCIIVYVDN
jgi:ABC-type cobalt transport system substrate-binding protein